jgi:hypothetical protein
MLKGREERHRWRIGRWKEGRHREERRRGIGGKRLGLGGKGIGVGRLERTEERHWHRKARTERGEALPEED